MQTTRKTAIDNYIAKYVAKNPRGVSRATAKEFGISRQASHGHVQRLVKEGILEARGSTSGRTYALLPLGQRDHLFQLEESPSENEVWRNYVADLLEGIPGNILGICHYGFTEMFNNALEHSNGDSISIRVAVDAVSIHMHVYDDGVGVFRKIREHYGLDDDREALFELSKGKVTTDPENHTGEGIFFTSRIFDSYGLLSGGLYFSHDAEDDTLFDKLDDPGTGTFVQMEIAVDSDRNTQDVFAQHSAENTLRFSRTTLYLQLLQRGNENLVSRSQARRLLSGIEKFSVVVLNFEGVDVIGQAFSDEVFRVFQQANPEIELIPVRTSQQVSGMIDRAQAT